MRAVKHWTLIRLDATPAANGVPPPSRARGELAVLVVGGYRKVVLAMAARAAERKRPAGLRARGVFVD